MAHGQFDHIERKTAIFVSGFPSPVNHFCVYYSCSLYTWIKTKTNENPLDTQ